MSPKSRLSILLINNYFPPEIGAASHLYYYLAKQLVARGHEVTVLTGLPRYNVAKQSYQEYVERLKGWSIEKVRQKTGAPYVLNVQDLFPQAAIDLGIMRSPLIIKLFRGLEKGIQICR